MTRRLSTLVPAALVVCMLGGGVTAHAQSTQSPRLGAGLSTSKGGGIGVNGGVLYPVKDLGIRSVGVVGAGSLLKFDGYSTLSFGAGLRWTRTLENSARNMRLYGQGLFGVSRYSGDGFSESDKGFTVGGGTGFAINPALDAFIEVDIARVLPSRFDGYNSLLFTFGVSKAFGQK